MGGRQKLMNGMLIKNKKNPEVIQTTILDSFSERYLTLIFGLIVHLNPVKQ